MSKRKIFLAAGFAMLLLALASVVYALGHPEGSFPWTPDLTYTLYAAYAAVMISMFVLAGRRGRT